MWLFPLESWMAVLLMYIQHEQEGEDRNSQGTARRATSQERKAYDEL